jgi:SAM-dependent methyltransferase
VSTDDCLIEMIHDVVLEHLPKDGVTVDAGSGVCRWPIYLRRCGYRVVGLEFNHDACVIARENDPGLGVVRGDVMNKPIKDGSVDAVLSLGVVEHNEPGPIDALREIHRILKPDGVLILAVPYNNPWRRLVMNPLLDYVTEKRRRASWKLGFAEYRFSRPEVRGFLQQSGFRVVSAHPNDLRAPKNMGLWVDYNNFFMNPFHRLDPRDLFILPGWRGKIAAALVRWAPWLVCGEVIFVARARK